MDEILKTMVESLVDNKDSISINKTEKDNHVRYDVTVSSDEMGRIIGRRGKIAQAIRTIMKPVASKEHKTVEVEFIDA
ncbi:MAG: KH domain-containing protein [Clostridia bacterium]|nr:KH domain-containing protein [Clostridia bacterium]